MSTSADSGIIWWAVGAGTRSHAFLAGDMRYAYCGLGPGLADVPVPAQHCAACTARLARIAAQWAEGEASENRGR